ncbi:fimbrial protein [Luteibacter sp.]|jgi:type 1 fimbria pilin|uniref:fimbrial protein n=1 Tax=Luteibacter sp. TaxID=1886636 RepID=UPI002F3F0E5D
MPSHALSGCFIAVLLLCSDTVQAGCLSHPSQGTAQVISFGLVKVPSDARPNDVLAVKDSPPWTPAKFKCKYPTLTSTLGIFATPSALGNGIYETNVPGVGVRVSFHGSGRLVPENTYANWIFLSNPLPNAHFRVELLKTGPLGKGGALQTGTLARAGYDGRVQVWVDLLDTRIEPPHPTCAFLSKRVVFNLGRVDGGVLAAQGHSHWATQQLVSTGCRDATQMLMTFAGTADEANPSLFKLQGSDAARGVAVEVRKDDPDEQAIPNSPVPLILPAPVESRSYGFRARYRHTGRPLAPGSANTSITVNVAYR